MADTEKPEIKKVEDETRIEPFAVQSFSEIGYKGKLPNSIVKIYKEFKRRKDILQPGRLSPEGFAYVSLLADLCDDKFSVKE